MSKSRLLSEAVKDISHKQSNCNDWTQAEIRVLEKNYGLKSAKEIKLLLPNRTIKAIWQMANLIGVNNKIPCWTKEEISILECHYVMERLSILAKRLPNRTINSIKIMATRLKLTKKRNTKKD